MGLVFIYRDGRVVVAFKDGYKVSFKLKPSQVVDYFDGYNSGDSETLNLDSLPYDDPIKTELEEKHRWKLIHVRLDPEGLYEIVFSYGFSKLADDIAPREFFEKNKNELEKYWEPNEGYYIFSLQKAVELGLISEKEAEEIYKKDGEVWIANIEDWFG